MGSGRVKIDFSDGYFSDNIISALHKCSARTLLGLKEKGLLRFSANDYILNHTSLTMNGLDDYAAAAGCSVSDLVFTGVYEKRPVYTKQDSFVLAALNTGLTSEEVKRFEKWCSLLFPNEVYDRDVTRVPDRLQLALSLLPYGALAEKAPLQNAAGETVVQPDIVERELSRFRGTGYSATVVLSSNIYPDLALLAGVSLHWILNLKTPLFCNTQAADKLFDRYTLLQPYERDRFCDYLEGLLAEKGDMGQSIIQLRKR